MSAFFEILKVKPGEERISLLLVGLMLFTSGGGAIGGNAIEALFFARFGVELLPTMYIILGLFSFATSMLITALMGRLPKQKLYVALPIALAFTLIGEWLVLPLNIRWFFAAVWLVMNVIGSLQGLLTWGLAGFVCDTRQAKRLFPLFSAGGILGTVLGGLATQPLALWLHAESLLLIWAAALFLSFFLGRALIQHSTVATVTTHGQTGMLEEMQRGYQFVRRSTIMQMVSYSAILFSICFFSLALPFSRGATAQFPDPDRLAGFLGLFQSLTTGVALLASLFLANRLFARFGIMPVLLVFPLIYLAGFGALVLFAPFALLVAVRFAQMAFMNGIAGTAWQAVFNIVPYEQRDQVRAFIGGVPEQAGTFIAGLVLLVGEQTLQPQQLYLVGFAAAALLVYFLWRASQAYGSALVDALRAGQPHMFFNEEQPFGGFRTDAAAVSVAIGGLNDPDAGIRRVSAEILGYLPVPQAVTALAETLADHDPQVRVAVLESLTRAQAADCLPEISACLRDPDPDVRMHALGSVSRLSDSAPNLAAWVEPLLNDADLLVRSQAARALLRGGAHARAQAVVNDLAVNSNPSVRASALQVLGECGDRSSFDLAFSALQDDQPVVRRAACAAMVSLDPGSALNPLMQHLDERDASVRRELAASLGKIGEPALKPLLEALSDPALEETALLALEGLPVQKISASLRARAQTAAQTALKYHRLARGLAQANKGGIPAMDQTRPLLEALLESSQRSGLNALRTLGLVVARDAVRTALENLASPDPVQRANALETLEASGERAFIQPLLVLWESEQSASAPLPAGWLLELLDDPYFWLRACAAWFATQTPAAKSMGAVLREKLNAMSSSDPDELVRTVAAYDPQGESAMNTLATISMMERILFLQRVPLFASLSPSDLKQLAAISTEAEYSDGQVLVRQGESGAEMFIIVSGVVRVLVAQEIREPVRMSGSADAGSAVREAATALEVARRDAGDCVGEMSLIIQEPRSATLVADGAVHTLCIGRKQFEGILRERPEISLSMLRILSRRLLETDSKIAGH